jgi:DNA-directed RNA polymerase subunit RPC12/RpoP
VIDSWRRRGFSDPNRPTASSTETLIPGTFILSSPNLYLSHASPPCLSSSVRHHLRCDRCSHRRPLCLRPTATITFFFKKLSLLQLVKFVIFHRVFFLFYKSYWHLSQNVQDSRERDRHLSWIIKNSEVKQSITLFIYKVCLFLFYKSQRLAPLQDLLDGACKRCGRRGRRSVFPSPQGNICSISVLPPNKTLFTDSSQCLRVTSSSKFRI